MYFSNCTCLVSGAQNLGKHKEEKEGKRERGNGGDTGSYYIALTQFAFADISTLTLPIACSRPFHV